MRVLTGIWEKHGGGFHSMVIGYQLEVEKTSGNSTDIAGFFNPMVFRGRILQREENKSNRQVAQMQVNGAEFSFEFCTV